MDMKKLTYQEFCEQYTRLPLQEEIDTFQKFHPTIDFMEEVDKVRASAYKEYLKIFEDGNAVVWTKPDCPFCVKAKDLLKQKGIEFEERVVGEHWTRDQLLEAAPNAKTVPQIWLEGKYIGTYDQLNEYLEQQTTKET